MTLVDQLQDLLPEVIEAVDTGDFTSLSQGGHQLLSDLSGLSDSDWDELIHDADDHDIRRKLAAPLRKRLLEMKREDIRRVAYQASFDLDISSQSLMITLRFETGHQSLNSKQDLEDTLWIGGSVLRALADVMGSMEETINIDIQKHFIGESFEQNLVHIETAVEEIRRIYTATQLE